MADGAPAVYILYGEDEFAISEFVGGLLEGMGDATTAELNIARLDGRTHSLDDFENALRLLPFLAPRRVVIFRHPLERTKNAAHQKRFLELLESTPPTTTLALLEDHPLTSDRDRRRKKIHWLDTWAEKHPGQARIRAFLLPGGAELTRWILNRARTHGGQFSPQAAQSLAGLVGAEPRQLDQEIYKLLTYVNFSRPVEPDDVELLTPLSAQVGDFALVNAVRDQNGRLALSLLRREMVKKDPLIIFQGIVYQFRLLLLAREALEERKSYQQLARELKINEYPVKLAFEQCPRFSLVRLEAIYRRLLETDESIKTGELPDEAALEALVAELTS